MKARIILYISALMIFWVFRGYRPAPKYDRIEIVSDGVFRLNEKSYPVVELENTIRAYRRSLSPDQKNNQRIRFVVDMDVTMGVVQDTRNALRKNGLLYLIYPEKPFWKFW